MTEGLASRRSGWPLWGHKSAVAMLEQAIRADRLSHAYLFAGPTGVGKRTLATIFAQAICCPTSRTDPAQPCRSCASCRRIERGSHPDVQVVSLASQAAATDKAGSKNTSLTIDTVRSLRAAAALRPMEARRKILIVDDAETLQGPAQEALLKTLEEPPTAVTIVLLATDAESLLPTIRSRCQVVGLPPVGSAAIEAGLVERGVEERLARELAALAAGRPGWAIAAATDPNAQARHAEAVIRAIAWIESSRYERLVTAVRLGDGFQKRRDEVFADLVALLSVWRDVMLAAAGVPDKATHASQSTKIGAIARSSGLGGAMEALVAVQQGIADLDANVRPRLALEGMVLRWPGLDER